MEEEIELRPYIELLVKRWYLIVGAALVAAIVAFVVSSMQPAEYEATALVAITEPQLRVQFEPRIEELSEDSQPLWTGGSEEYSGWQLGLNRYLAPQHPQSIWTCVTT